MTSKIKGKTMSASNRGPVRRRISLLAGGSLAAATIVLAGGGVALAPTAALAANECVPIGVDPSVNGPTADTYACAGSATYTATGITYSSAGPLTVNSTGGMNVGTVGINLTGNTSDSVTFTATGIITGTAGPVIDVTSVSGPISLTTVGVTGTNINVTHGIQAVSSGGGSITISAPTGNINVTSTTVGAQQQAAIRAVSTGGNGTVSVTTGGTVTGRVYGIQAQSSGSGALTISASGAVNTTAATGVATIDAISGTGLLTVDVVGGNNTNIGGNAGAAIRTNAGGDAVINLGAQRNISANSASAGALNLTSVGTTTVNNASNGLVAGVIVRAAGGGLVFNNDSGVPLAAGQGMTGRMELGAVTGASTINNNGRWTTSGTSTFGAGESTLNNAGRLEFSVPVTFVGLDLLDNSGEIRFGATRTATGQVLSAPGATFNGSEGGVLQMEASLGGAGQESCTATVLVADCLDLTGGATSGVTPIFLTAIGDIGAGANTIVLVDVSGGESRQGDFVLDRTSTNYALDTLYDAIITTPGVSAYALIYDEDAQQHVLTSVIPGQRLEYVAAAQEVLSAWHTTSDTVAGRQADLRDRGDPGFWVRATGEQTIRELDLTFSAGGSEFDYADEYELQTSTVIGGFDLLPGATASGGYVLGVHLGYVRSLLERASSPTTDEMAGVTAGLYAGWWGNNGLTLDATVNTNFLQLDHDHSLEEVSRTNVMSAGFRAEAGWRKDLSETFYVQPIASASYVRAEIKEVSQTSFAAFWEDIDSLRGGLGLRVGGDLDLGDAGLGYWVVGQAWKEFSGDGALTLSTSAEEAQIHDDLVGEFQELGAGLSLSNASDTLEGFVSGGAKFADGMDNYSASVGLRLRW